MNVLKLILNISCFCVLLVSVLCSDEVTLENRLKGGELADVGEIPYIVSVRGHNRHVCGGSILNEFFVLTAAHCVHGYEDKPELFSIQYGITIISEKWPNVRNVSKVIKHPDYLLNDQNPNDIAILQLKKKITFGDDVSPVNLPLPFQEVKVGSDALLAGWGLNETGGRLQFQLHKVVITVFSDKICSEDKNYDTDFHICAGIPEGGKGQCTGDSGGPLVVDGVQYGIVSWSVKPCASKGHPGYFTNIPKYRDWIQIELNKNNIRTLTTEKPNKYLGNN